MHIENRNRNHLPARQNYTASPAPAAPAAALRKASPSSGYDDAGSHRPSAPSSSGKASPRLRCPTRGEALPEEEGADGLCDPASSYPDDGDALRRAAAGAAGAGEAV